MNTKLRNNQQNRRRQTAIAGLVVILIGCSILAVLANQYLKHKTTENWPTTTATIISLSVASASNTPRFPDTFSNYVKVGYTYNVQDIEYSGTQKFVSSRQSIRDVQSNIFTDYNIGSTHTARYDPSNPEESVLAYSPVGPPPWLAYGILLVLLGSALFVFNRKR